MNSNIAVDPVFILGITERSGTHFLFNMLCLHPDLDPGGPIWENYLLDRADLLDQFVTYLYSTWDSRWSINDAVGPPDLLLQFLGDALLRFLKIQVGKTHTVDTERRPGAGHRRLITKSPSVNNLEMFFRLFPRSQLIIIVRDGRSVVESGVKTFGWDYELSMQHWANAARTIIAFERANQQANFRFKIVKYEELLDKDTKTIRDILNFLELDPDKYDFAAIPHLPVVGSSQVRDSEGAVHWEPIAKPDNFNPFTRWRHWGQGRHTRFNWIAGDLMSTLGYAIEPSINSPASQIWNRALDLKYQARAALPYIVRIKSLAARILRSRRA
jgi:Sulfotransferase family